MFSALLLEHEQEHASRTRIQQLKEGKENCLTTVVCCSRERLRTCIDAKEGCISVVLTEMATSSRTPSKRALLAAARQEDASVAKRPKRRADLTIEAM
eukprot:5753856-Amphidinium_carterae.1